MKKIFKREIVCLLVFVMTASLSLTTVNAQEYPDPYSSNGKVGYKEVEDYKCEYELNNYSGYKTHINLFVIIQAKSGLPIIQWSYRFDGTFNDGNEKCDYRFAFDINVIRTSLAEKVSLSDGDDTDAYMEIKTFGIAPGFYNFYFYGKNRSGSDQYGNKFFIKTIAPDFASHDNDTAYQNSHEPCVEITGTEEINPRVYVVISEEQWYYDHETAIYDFVKNTEKSYRIDDEEWKIDHGSLEEIDVEVPEENFDHLLDVAQPEVTVEETAEESPHFEEITPIPTSVPVQDNSSTVKMGIIGGVIIVVVVLGMLVAKYMKKRYE